LGARRTIERYHPLLMLEWCEPWAKRYGVSLEQFEKLLGDLGYLQIMTNMTDRIYKYQP
jgi:hypothetical protein